MIRAKEGREINADESVGIGLVRTGLRFSRVRAGKPKIESPLAGKRHWFMGQEKRYCGSIAFLLRCFLGRGFPLQERLDWVRCRAVNLNGVRARRWVFRPL